MAVVPSILSPDPLTPNSPQMSLVYSALPLPEPRVSGCKQNFVHWPFKRLSASPTISPFQKPCYFSQLDVIWVTFWLWCYRLGNPAWGLDPTFSGVTPQLLKYPSRTLAATFWSPAPALSHLLGIPYQSCCSERGSSIYPWL